MRTFLRNIVDYLVYVVVRILICIVQALTLDRCARLARAFATLFCDVLHMRQSVIDDNLRHALPDLNDAQLRDLRWRMWEHLCLMVVEVVHAPRKIHDTNWRDYVTLHRSDEMIRTFFDDRPTVIICGHYGNFEVSGFVLSLLGFPTFTIARTLDNPYLDRFLNDFRSASGQFILPKTGSSYQVDEALKGGGILAVLGDQHAGPKGCWVEFFGRPASSHKAIALFSLSSESPAMFCFTRRTHGPLRQVMGTHGILDPLTIGPEMRTVPAITEWYTRLLEKTILTAPEQYWWVHRRWKDVRGRKSATERTKAA